MYVCILYFPLFVHSTPQVSGPGLQSATVNHLTHVLIELTDSSNRPCSVQQNITAELEHVSEVTSISPSIAVAATSTSQYKVSFTAVSRGQHKLHIRLNDIEINGSPFIMTVYPDPTQLAQPVNVVTGLNYPYGIALNSHGKMIVTQRNDEQCLMSIEEQSIREYGDNPEKMSLPKGIAIDDKDNIYVSSDRKLHKFSSTGQQIKSVGQRGSGEGDFNDPCGVAVHNDCVYVCDRENHRIQIFDLDLNFKRSIGSKGRGEGEFDAPKDIKLDNDGNMYIAEWNNARVQVLDSSGQFIRMFDEENVHHPTALHIIDKHVYVSNIGGNNIVVYDTSGQYIASFGGSGREKGKLMGPRSITSCANGYIYVCDGSNDRIQIF